MKFKITTNNPQVVACYSYLDLVFVSGDVRAVFECCRDLVHRGHKLLSHPLSSSLKPGRIPYKTVVLTSVPASTVDPDSLKYIEAALDAFEKTRYRGQLSLPAKVMADYAAVDLSIFESALTSLRTN